MNVTMPGFTAEASIYRTENYRGRQADGVSGGFQAVEAALIRAQPPINMRITVGRFFLPDSMARLLLFYYGRLVFLHAAVRWGMYRAHSAA